MTLSEAKYEARCDAISRQSPQFIISYLNCEDEFGVVDSPIEDATTTIVYKVWPDGNIRGWYSNSKKEKL